LKVLIIIPCYNEGQNIVPLLEELKSVQLKGVQLDVLPVNDCSKDNTLACLQAHTLSYLNLPNNLGIGGAVQSGIKYAQRGNYDFAMQMDGDGQHPPSEIFKFIEAAQKTGSDICLGSRYIMYEGFQSTAVRRFGIKFLNGLIKFTTGQTVYDSTSGFRLFSKRAINLFADYYPDKYPEPEVIVHGKLSGLSIHEIPVFMKDRVGGQSSITGVGASLYYMVKVSLAIIIIRCYFLFSKSH
jgi:glycosyltransferase involved in cell wall biosynthesis